MIGKALRKHSLHGKTAVLVLLKLFISGNAFLFDCLRTTKKTRWFNEDVDSTSHIYKSGYIHHNLCFACYIRQYSLS